MTDRPDILRRAAADMRDRHGPEHPRHTYWAAVAYWLESVALALTVAPDMAGAHAVNVATAYLGQS